MNALAFRATGSEANKTTGYARLTVFATAHGEIPKAAQAEAAREKPMASRAERITANPRRAAAVAAARQRLGAWMEQEEALQQPMALAALRLRAGLSQAELAQRLKTSQPNIARFEKSPDNPTLDSIRGWANALGVEVMDVISAIEATTAQRKA